MKDKKDFAHPRSHPTKVRARGRGRHALFGCCSELSCSLLPWYLFNMSLQSFCSFPIISTTTTSSDPTMAPKKTKAPPTTFFGLMKMSLAMLEDKEKRGVLSPGLGRVPPKTEVFAKPHDDEVVVFKDFFPAGLRFPLDPAVIDIFARYGVFLHHTTPNSFARISLFIWLSKTCCITPNLENFAWVMRVHYQLKTIFVRGSDGKSTEMEP